MSQARKNLVLILGDQLSRNLSSLQGLAKKDTHIVMGELADEAGYVPHHKKKIIFLFSAMRHFARDLEQAGWSVSYTEYSAGGCASFTALLKSAIDAVKPQKIIVTEPGEYRLADEFNTWADLFDIEVDIRPDRRFLCDHGKFKAWADGRKTLRMEFFYREMRRETGLLIDNDGEPEGGQWNFDQENRKPPKDGLDLPARLRIEPDDITRAVIDLVNDQFADHFGDSEPFWFAVTRDDAEKALDHFIDDCLPLFGDYQDAMVLGEKFLFHSLLSLYINAGLLDPLEACKRAEKAWADSHAPLNAVEGFIRQIIGWREFIRGIYWREGADYTTRNFFKAGRALPSFYWDGDTDMACIRASVNQTREEAYAHHIQRLMVTGNFALIAGIDPHAVHEWYLAVYADAYEWVEAPNVIGMALFADGGVLASKPYAASGAYINRMSDYCRNCDYAVTKKTEENACPFNALYWDFLIRNEDQLRDNARLGQIFRNWDRMDANKKRAYRARARAILDRLDAGKRV